jgi:transposase
VRAALDATGLDTRHASRYYARRAGRQRGKSKGWPKLTAVFDTHSHLILAALATRGPGNDAPQFRPAARAATARTPIDTLLADAGYDAEHLHALARERLGVRSTVIGLNPRSHGRKRPGTKYRRQMVGRFRKRPRGSRYRRVYGQRWQAESGFSRLKRRLGAALRARTWAAQTAEAVLRAIVHNLMLLAASP